MESLIIILDIKLLLVGSIKISSSVAERDKTPPLKIVVR